MTHLVIERRRYIQRSHFLSLLYYSIYSSSSFLVQPPPPPPFPLPLALHLQACRCLICSLGFSSKFATHMFRALVICLFLAFLSFKIRHNMSMTMTNHIPIWYRKKSTLNLFKTSITDEG